ncbi:hypothetical protein DL765_011372 [Monosporascus sp. GIB2]|nr:hypothetical protein DL765_011372 [Monosporascus sp. GIB2]
MVGAPTPSRYVNLMAEILGYMWFVSKPSRVLRRAVRRRDIEPDVFPAGTPRASKQGPVVKPVVRAERHGISPAELCVTTEGSLWNWAPRFPSGVYPAAPVHLKRQMAPSVPGRRTRSWRWEREPGPDVHERAPLVCPPLPPADVLSLVALDGGSVTLIDDDAVSGISLKADHGPH